MTPQQREAHMELTDLFNQALRLGADASRIQREHFPEESSWCDAYQVFRFATSGNPYDRTFEKLLENINRRDEEEYES